MLRRHLASLTEQLCALPWLPTRLLRRHAGDTGYPTGEPKQRILVVQPREDVHLKLEEALRLAESHSGPGPHPFTLVGPRRGFTRTASTHFPRGLVLQVQRAIEQEKPTRVFANVILSGMQQRNLEACWQLPLLDRMSIIIDIFSQRARTREAKIQAQVALLDYQISRVVRRLDSSGARRFGGPLGGTYGLDASEVVSARERGRSSSMAGGLGGAGGGGESELALQRSRIRARATALRKQLWEVQKTRRLQREGRKRSRIPVVAVVGYTNAGKSSLVNALCQSQISARNRLFETLDPTLRRVMLPSGREVILSDTVGFITDLPTQLLQAFKATLEEVTEADLLLHVVDASSTHASRHRTTVVNILRELGISDMRLRRRMVEVLNKDDLVAQRAQQQTPPGAFWALQQERDEGREGAAEAAAEEEGDGSPAQDTGGGESGNPSVHKAVEGWSGTPQGDPQGDVLRGKSLSEARGEAPGLSSVSSAAGAAGEAGGAAAEVLGPVAITPEGAVAEVPGSPASSPEGAAAGERPGAGAAAVEVEVSERGGEQGGKEEEGLSPPPRKRLRPSPGSDAEDDDGWLGTHPGGPRRGDLTAKLPGVLSKGAPAAKPPGGVRRGALAAKPPGGLLRGTQVTQPSATAEGGEEEGNPNPNPKPPLMHEDVMREALDLASWQQRIREAAAAPPRGPGAQGDADEGAFSDTVVRTSAVTRQGLAQLLQAIDAKVSALAAARDLAESAARRGPSMLE